MSRALLLHEQVVLLGLVDDTGKTSSGSWLNVAIAAAVLGELSLAGRIALERPRRSVLVVPRSQTALGDRILDEALGRIARAKRPSSLASWVSRLSGTRDLLRRAAEPLVHRGILRHQRVPFLVFFERSVYPTVDPVPERQMLDELRALVLGDEVPLGDAPARTRVLIGIASATGLLRANLDRKELRKRKARLEAISEGEPVARAARDAVGAAIAAMSSG